MTDRFTPFAPSGAPPILTANCAARIPTQEMAAPFHFAGDDKEKRK